jgi:hypothetical protein
MATAGRSGNLLVFVSMLAAVYSLLWFLLPVIPAELVLPLRPAFPADSQLLLTIPLRTLVGAILGAAVVMTTTLKS